MNAQPFAHTLVAKRLYLGPGPEEYNRHQDIAILPADSFEGAVNSSLGMLRGVHVRASIIAASLSPWAVRAVRKIVAETMGHFGAVGLLRSGSIGMLYLGPHDCTNATAVQAQIRRRIERRLNEKGWPIEVQGVELSVVGGWTDEMTGSADFIGLFEPADANN